MQDSSNSSVLAVELLQSLMYMYLIAMPVCKILGAGNFGSIFMDLLHYSLAVI